MTSRSPRANQRTAVLAHIKALRDALAWTRDQWTVTGRIADPVTEDGSVRNHTWRDRRPDEYPEMSADEWAKLWKYTGDMMQRLQQLRDLAAEQYAVTRNSATAEERAEASRLAAKHGTTPAVALDAMRRADARNAARQVRETAR
jgi:hypothetical protein